MPRQSQSGSGSNSGDEIGPEQEQYSYQMYPYQTTQAASSSVYSHASDSSYYQEYQPSPVGSTSTSSLPAGYGQYTASDYQASLPNVSANSSVERLESAFDGNSFDVEGQYYRMENRGNGRGFDLQHWTGQAWKAIKNEERRNQVLLGAAFVTQAVGTLAGWPKVYAGGVGAGGAQLMNTVLTAAYNQWQIHRNPQNPHPKPNLWQIVPAVANAVGQGVYGGLTPSNPQAAGYGAAVAGLSYVASGLLPQQGQYVPPTTQPNTSSGQQNQSNTTGTQLPNPGNVRRR
ncbi:hypothetical protein AWW66_27095 [Micromonospora rosaria]|uniref:Uncharacterized protein n=1 Tax=Micromonospora rosaria TaxID=47874 RepID=A0A136PKM1_9ACTN|nr:hypothetical protein [Micromonospora rosaria]KXK58911.1 hypothetical protein AWW66_27095 [Micromonospora rosaria]